MTTATTGNHGTRHPLRQARLTHRETTWTRPGLLPVRGMTPTRRP